MAPIQQLWNRRWTCWRSMRMHLLLKLLTTKKQYYPTSMGESEMKK